MGDGDVPPPGLVTENVSVRHCDACETDTPLVTPVRGKPKKFLATLVLEVDGPLIWNVSKSKRSWKERFVSRSINKRNKNGKYLTNV